MSTTSQLVADYWKKHCPICRQSFGTQTECLVHCIGDHVTCQMCDKHFCGKAGNVIQMFVPKLKLVCRTCFQTKIPFEKIWFISLKHKNYMIYSGEDVPEWAEYVHSQGYSQIEVIRFLFGSSSS